MRNWLDSSPDAVAEGDAPTQSEGLSRRSLLKKAGIVGAATVWATPVIQSAVAPAFASSGPPGGGGAPNCDPCEVNGDCASGNCSSGRCRPAGDDAAHYCCSDDDCHQFVGHNRNCGSDHVCGGQGAACHDDKDCARPPEAADCFNCDASANPPNKTCQYAGNQKCRDRSNSTPH